MNTPLLQINNLAKTYQGARPVFADIDFDVNASEVVCLLGASGCGKSSLLKALAGLHPVDDGEIRFKGSLLNKPDARIGLVFQSACLLPWLTVRQNAAFPLTLQCEAKLSRKEVHERAETALQWVGLQHYADAYPDQLSGGMAQRVALARALVKNPDLLLMDEPFSALDAITRLNMQQLLLQLLAHRRNAVLLVTHDIDEALILGDRILLMGGSPGHIVQEWSIDMPQPRANHLHDLIGIRMEILERLSDVAGDYVLENVNKSV
jgi:NitT/TauT family transport system ATP-binding protein